MSGVHHDGTWLGAFLLEQCLSLHTLGVGHGDGAQDGVCPVYVAVDPVHGQPVGGLDALADDGVIGGKAGGSVDLGAGGEGESVSARALFHPGSGLGGRSEAHL